MYSLSFLSFLELYLDFQFNKVSGLFFKKYYIFQRLFLAILHTIEISASIEIVKNID